MNTLVSDQIPTKPDKVEMSATFPFKLDKVYNVTLIKTINGQISYRVIVHDEPDETRVEVVTQTIKQRCETHGAFDIQKLQEVEP
jgi:hypothetical protein